MNVCMLVTNSGVEDPRVCMEAETLARGGYGVTVIAWDREADHDIKQRQNGVDFVRLKLHSTHGRGVTQPVFIAGFWLRAWRVIRQLRPDVVHCHDLDTLPLGWYAARCLHVRLVFDAHENFPDMMTGHLPSAAVTALRALERHLVPRCDVLITVGERLAGHYRALGAGKVVVVGNWKDPADFRFPPETIRRTREELGLKNGVIAISYIANLGRERRLEPLLAAVAADKRFACMIGGDGPQATLVRIYATSHENIAYVGRIPPDRVPLITAACDVVYYGFDETNPNARWSAPNKLYEAIAAGKPILTGDFGEIGQTVREETCGIIGKMDSASGCSRALQQLAKPGALARLGRNAVRASRFYSRKRGNSFLLDAYRQLARPTRGTQNEMPWVAAKSKETG